MGLGTLRGVGEEAQMLEEERSLQLVNKTLLYINGEQILAYDIKIKKR